MARKKIGELLIERGFITENELKFGLDMQKQTHAKLGEVFVTNEIISHEELSQTLGAQLGVEYVDLTRITIPEELSGLVRRNIARQNHLVPVRRQQDTLYVAMDDPLNYLALDEVRKATNMKVVPLIATPAAIDRSINTLYGNENANKAIADYKKEVGADEKKQAEGPSFSNFDFVISSNSISGDGDSAPTIRLVNSIIERAVLERASDIHFEPRENEMEVRMRIDGIMRPILNVPKDLTPAAIARIKTMSGMDVAEKRIPQDGRFAVAVLDKSIDMRVSTLPIAWGEKVVCRLLDKSNTDIRKENLGLRPDDVEKYEKLIHYKNGVMLLVGPTGSGKTTTMYAMLNELNTKDVNLVTLEDPIEYNIDGLNQVQINPKVNMTFANGLRAILRQDPDIVSVGEIRDGETAEISMRAALTGKLVLSTIHTNDAVGAVDRLVDIGVEPYLISATLRGVVSQRLVRRICPYCGEEYTPTAEDEEVIGVKIDPSVKFRRGRGCQQCFETGYSGRIAVFEIMMVNSQIRDLIYKRAGRSAIEAELSKPENHFVSLRDAAIKLVYEGVTTIDEVMRITNERD
ncbi:MAG: type II/IV secretion system protein [Butyrivibrio sp.]|nr:type II/IV secretion system protein [Butyrivibrio sp.]